MSHSDLLNSVTDEDSPSASESSPDARVDALHRYGILDTPPESAFDALANLAATIFGAPVAMVNFIAEDRQWFKSAVGVDVRETGLDISVCLHTIQSDGVMIVEDLAADDRFAGNPVLEDWGLRFYAGAPIVTPDGVRIGTVCVMDERPRTPEPEHVHRLRDLASLAVDELELRRENEQLQRAEARFRTVVENAQPVIFMVDREGTFLLSEGRDLQALGLKPGEVVGESVFDRYGDVPEIVDGIQRALDGEYVDTEITVDDRVFDSCYSPVYEGDGTVVGVMGTAADITDKRRTEQSLRENNQRLRLALDAANAGSFEYDIATDRVLWDRHSIDLYGLDLEPGVQDASRLQDLVLDEDLGPLEAVVDRAVEEGDPRYEVSYRIRRADDGDVRSIRSHGIIVRDESGTAERIIGVNQDVTDREQREEQLRLLEAAVEHSLLTVLITEAEPLDAPGPTTVYVNPAFTEMTGYDSDEIVGRSPRLLQGPETERAPLDRIRAALERDEPIREIVRNYAKDGTPYWNDLFIAPVRDADGTVTHYVSLQNDVTERVRRREELEEAKEAAEEADRIKTALLSNMNHEFRTPLTSILTFSELIRDNPEVADRFADRILGGGRRLLHTLNTVMDFAELEGGGRSVTPGTFHLGDVVRSVADDFRENARQKELDLSVEIGEEIGTVVLDRHRVERILTHLLHNAVKFTEDGSITVTAGLGTDRADGPVELCVADTGVGIDPDRQPEIFEEFAQASRGLDRTHEGNGLGLTIVQRLVDQLDGTLDLESTPGEGTRVTVRLPIDGDLD